MINQTNSMNAVPFYARLEDQMAFRNGGPALLCPNNRIPAFQFQSDQYDEDPKVFLVSIDKELALPIPSSSFDIVQTTSFVRYTYSGDTLTSALPCGLYYISCRVQIPDLTTGYMQYSARLNMQEMGSGEWVEFRMYNGTDSFQIVTIGEMSEAVISDLWEKKVNDEWEPLLGNNGQNGIIINESALPGVSTMIRLTRTTATRKVTGQGIVWKDADPLKSALIQYPNGEESFDDNYWKLEFTSDEDIHDVYYEGGFVQEVYLNGTFDDLVMDEEDEVYGTPNGSVYKASSVVIPRAVFSFVNAPDFMPYICESAARHPNVKLVRQSDGVFYNMKDIEFEFSKSSNPLAIDGQISFQNLILYQTGQKRSLETGNEY